jgi:polyisoprenoid-binding protein YceI
MRAFIAGLIFVLSLSAADVKIAAGDYTVDAGHSKAGFEVAHLVIATIEGRFNKFTGNVKVDKAISITAEIDTASIDTNNAARDKELRGAAFFESDKYPKMTFVSSKVDLKNNALKVTGNLTIRNVTKPVILTGKVLGTLKDGMGREKVAATLTGKISRKSFGLVWNDLVEAAPVAGDQVTIQLRIEATRVKQ